MRKAPFIPGAFPIRLHEPAHRYNEGYSPTFSKNLLIVEAFARIRAASGEVAEWSKALPC